MAAMGGKENEISFAEFPLVSLALEVKSGVAPDHQHPLVAVLIIPLPFGCRMPGRDDPLDAQARPLKQRLRNLLGKRLRGQAAHEASGFRLRGQGAAFSCVTW